jgi:tetratricopeptide (TPR) repeat protein
MKPSSSREQFDKIIVSLSSHINAEEFDEALQILDNFYREHIQNSDDPRGLKNRCNSWKALILDKQGKYPDALEAYLSLDYEPEENEYSLTQSQVAKLYLKLGQSAKSLSVLDRLIASEITYIVDEGLPILALYGEVIESSKEIPISTKYLELLKNIVATLDMNDFIPDISSREKTIETIQALDQKHREANKRYQWLSLSLYSTEDKAEQAALLNEYINSESTGAYREKAREKLKSLD